MKTQDDIDASAYMAKDTSAAERLRKSEVARAKRKAVKEKKELNRGVFDKSKLTYTDGDNT